MSFKDHLAANLKTAALSLNTAWTHTAQNAGWPDSLHSQVSVNTSAGGVNFDYPSDIAEDVFDMEYGTVGKNPKAAMRALDQIGKKQIEKAIYKATSDEMSDSGLF
jgi:hypothetical protein